MRTYSWLLAIVISLCVFGSAQAAGLKEAQNDAARSIDELRQYDVRNAGLQADWEKETVRVDASPVSLQEKQRAYAWMKYQRRLKTIDVLEAFALVYEQKISELTWIEGRAQVA